MLETNKKKNTILDIKTLQSQLSDSRKELLNLRFQKSNGQLEKTAKIKKTKKDIARLMTTLNEKKESQNA